MAELHCTNCGYLVDADANFCPNCGKSIIPANDDSGAQTASIQEADSESRTLTIRFFQTVSEQWSTGRMRPGRWLGLLGLAVTAITLGILMGGDESDHLIASFLGLGGLFVTAVGLVSLLASYILGRARKKLQPS